MSDKTLAPAAVGIRLGSHTLTLAVARLGEGFDPRPTVVASDSGERCTPAIVARTNGEWVLGEAAKAQEAKNPKNTFKNLVALAGATAEEALDGAALAKLLKGLTIASVKPPPPPPSEAGGAGAGEAAALLGLQPVDSASGEPDGEATCPGALLARLLRRLKEEAEQYVGGGKVGPCVLALAAHATPAQKEAVASAGREAGLDVLQVLSEPVAVALANDADTFVAPPASTKPAVDPSVWVVVDLGGSSLAVSVLRIDRGVVSVASHVNSRQLSGGLLVERLAKFAASQFSRKTGMDPLESKKPAARLRLACEGVLRFLSNAPQADLEVESLCEGMDLRLRVSRARFEDLCSDLWPILDQTLDKALSGAGVGRGDVATAVLAGGGSRVPKLATRLKALLPCKGAEAQQRAEEAEEAAALGAAAQAARLVCSGGSSAGASQGFNKEYKKAKPKLHKLVPAKAELPCLALSLGLRGAGLAGGGAPLALQGAHLPIQGAVTVCPLEGAAKGELALDLVEGPDDAGVATLTLAKLGGAAALVATLDVTKKGAVKLRVRAVKSGGDGSGASPELEEPAPEGWGVLVEIPPPN
mmetsp:Transcript_2448/g.5323  ORF Transcript_2448/g.5323 Transcript_2448/m.5323 type:complete len:586 (+) Transcript_2448:82-1839(+)